MTREELQKELRILFEEAVAIDSEQFGEADYDRLGSEYTKDALELINQHIAEVIGEDEPEQEGGIFRIMRVNVPSPDQVAKNELRAEQRKRAGLDI